MKVFFDTEFTGLHQFTTLVSIGLVAENGEEFYAEFTDYDKAQIDSWLQENIIDKLTLQPLGKHNTPIVWPANSFLGNTDRIRIELNKWLSQFDNPIQMISDCLSYDWVLFCQIWGHAFNIPSQVSPAPRDINQDIADFLNIDEKEAFDVNREEFAELDSQKQKHYALWDAGVIKACYEKMRSNGY